jgi:hypothetical protein
VRKTWLLENLALSAAAKMDTRPASFGGACVASQGVEPAGQAESCAELHARRAHSMGRGAARGGRGTRRKTIVHLQLLPATPNLAYEPLLAVLPRRKRSGRKQSTPEEKLFGWST